MDRTFGLSAAKSTGVIVPNTVYIKQTKTKTRSVKKKKKKRLAKQDEAITKRLIEKWKENDIDDECLKELFNQVDSAFPQYVPEQSCNKFRNSGNMIPGTSPPRIPAKHSSSSSSGNRIRTSKELLVGNPKTTDMKTDDVVRWIDLRNNYLSQLRTLFSSLNDQNLDDTVQKKSVTLLMLLGALRKISIRIVSTFEIVCLQYNNKRIKTKVDTTILMQMTDYIRSMADSLDWMGSYLNICQSFLHINPTLNPFLSIQRIDGQSALYGDASSTGKSKKNLIKLAEIGNIPFELTLSEDELQHCSHLGYIIYTLHNNNTTKTAQELKNESAIFDELKKPTQTDYLYSDPYEMQISMTNNNTGNNANSVMDENVFDEMSSPSYFLNNQLDEAVVRGNQGNRGSGEKDGTKPFSEQFVEKRDSYRHMLNYGSNNVPEEIATVDVRFATTDMNTPFDMSTGNGSSNMVLHSNTTQFHTNEIPSMREYSDRKPDKMSLHQIRGTEAIKGDSVAVRRVGNRDGSASGYRNVDGDDDIVAVKVINIYKLRFAWKYWRREFVGLRIIKPFIAYREKKIKQKIFHRLQLCLWQNFVYKSLVLRYEKRLKKHVFCNGFIKYHQWCYRLKTFYKKQLKKCMYKYFVLLHKWTINTFANRKLIKNRRFRFISNSFRLLKSNVILNKHLLQSKLRHSSNLLFCDFFMRQVCFCKWNYFRLYSKKLDVVEELVENYHLKNALVKWCVLTWPPKAKLTMREQINALRESIDSKIAIVKDGAGSASNSLRNSIQKHCGELVPSIRPHMDRLLQSVRSSSNKNTVHPILKSPVSERETRRKLRIANAVKHTKQKSIQVNKLEPTGIDAFPLAGEQE